MVRCFECKKKIPLGMEINCKCEQKFCMKHKHAEEHNCSYDYKLKGCEIIEKNNPIIIGEKIVKV